MNYLQDWQTNVPHVSTVENRDRSLRTRADAFWRHEASDTAQIKNIICKSLAKAMPSNNWPAAHMRHAADVQQHLIKSAVMRRTTHSRP